MKTKKVFIYTILPAILFALSFVNCKPQQTVEPSLTLKDKIKGKTYVLGSVTKSGVNVTSEFTGFKISFSADATGVSITSGGTNSATCTAIANVASNTITLSTPDCFRTSTLTNVSTNGDGTTLNFTCTLPSSSIVITPGGRTSSTSDYIFNLVKQ